MRVSNYRDDSFDDKTIKLNLTFEKLYSFQNDRNNFQTLDDPSRFFAQEYNIDDRAYDVQHFRRG